jgi:hypothetical protein
MFVAMAGAGALVTAALIWTVLVFASLLRRMSRHSVTSGSGWSTQVDLPEVRATVVPPGIDGRGFHPGEEHVPLYRA